MSNPEGFNPLPPLGRNLNVKEGEEVKRLPEELDKEGTLFVYGYLLIHEKLRDLLNTRKPDFPIHEAKNIEDARRLVADPDAIVILRDVRMEGVRVDVVSEQQMRNWLDEEAPDSTKKLVKKGILTEVSTHGGLYARVVKENPRFLNGGLVFGLTKEELLPLDEFEMAPVYKRTLVPELFIEGQKYAPQHIEFYAGDDKYKKDEYEPMRIKHLLSDGRKPGNLSEHMKFSRKVRPSAVEHKRKPIE